VNTTRTILLAAACALTAPSAARAQTATVAGEVVAREGGEPLPFTAVAVPARGAQRLASERGTFTLRDLPPGEVRLRFTRIGYAPKDTVLTVAAGETAQVRVTMTRLVVQLPRVVVEGACTDRTPFEPQPPVLAELFDQVRQNAERIRLLASERPFVYRAESVGGHRDRDGNVLGKADVDTVERGPLPLRPYVPRGVAYRGVWRGKPAWMIMSPELPHLADTAFTNNHCLWYAGQERLGADSVIRVDFEPVPWLAKEVDLEGSVYLRADDYQVVELFTKLNRIPSWNRVMIGYTNRARFGEIVPGVPVITGWELTNVFRNDRPPFVQTGKVIGVRWLDVPTEKRDTVPRPPR
jgi:hypothetical protein